MKLLKSIPFILCMTIFNANAYTLTTDVQTTLQIQDSCTFTQPTYTTQFPAMTIGEIGKTSIQISHICSNGLSYSIGMKSSSPYISSGEVPATGTGENLRVIAYSDSAYTKNLATNKINGSGDGLVHNKTIYFKLISKDSQDGKVQKSGSFTAIYPIEIYY